MISENSTKSNNSNDSTKSNTQYQSTHSYNDGTYTRTYHMTLPSLSVTMTRLTVKPETRPDNFTQNPSSPTVAIPAEKPDQDNKKRPWSKCADDLSANDNIDTDIDNNINVTLHYNDDGNVISRKVINVQKTKPKPKTEPKIEPKIEVKTNENSNHNIYPNNENVLTLGQYLSDIDYDVEYDTSFGPEYTARPICTNQKLPDTSSTGFIEKHINVLNNFSKQNTNKWYNSQNNPRNYWDDQTIYDRQSILDKLAISDSQTTLDERVTRNNQKASGDTMDDFNVRVYANRMNNPDIIRLTDKDTVAKHKKEATNKFVQMCLKDSVASTIEFYFDNNNLIDVHYNDDEAFRNACIANNTCLAQTIYDLGNVKIRERNDYAFHMACLNSNIELANWFKSIDDRYFFLIIQDGDKSKIDVNSCKYTEKSGQQSVKQTVIPKPVNDNDSAQYNYPYDGYGYDYGSDFSLVNDFDDDLDSNIVIDDDGFVVDTINNDDINNNNHIEIDVNNNQYGFVPAIQDNYDGNNCVRRLN